MNPTRSPNSSSDEKGGRSHSVEPGHRSARFLANMGTLWSSLLGGFATPPAAFEYALEHDIDRNRGALTVWARWLTFAGVAFWLWGAISSGRTPLPAGTIAVAVLVSTTIAWRWDVIGGWLFIAQAIGFAAYVFLCSADRAGIVVFCLPSLVTGLLFVAGRMTSPGDQRGEAGLSAKGG